MTPKILDYIDGRIIITPEAFMIKELNDIINKHGDGTPSGGGAEPYLAYVHLMTHPESPYINLPEEELSDTVKFDIIQSIGDFEEDDELIKPAIERLSRQWLTRSKRYFDALGTIMEAVVSHAKGGIEISASGKDANLNEYNRMMKDAGATFKSYREVEKIVDEELKAKMKGKSVLGDY